MRSCLWLFLICVYYSASSQANIPAHSRNASFESLASLWLRGLQPDVPIKCGLPALSNALTQQNELNKAQLDGIAILRTRPETQKNILVGSFRVHYDTTGPNEPAILDNGGIRIPGTSNRYADSVASIANYCLRFQRDSLGFIPPPSDNSAGGGNEYDIYIQNLGSSLYGETVPETPINNKPQGGTHTTFMRIHHDFSFVNPAANRGLPGLRVTLAHELHHAIQIGNYGYWESDQYFYEMTSVWMEDAVYTDVNDYYQYLRSSSGHFRHPEISFTSNDFVVYSRGIWCQFLEKKFGRPIILAIWNEIQSQRPILALDEILSRSQYASSFVDAFVVWTNWNLFTGDRSDPSLFYPEGANYPLVTQVTTEFSAGTRSYGGTVQAVATRYHDITAPSNRVTFPVTNINIAAALDQTTGSQEYSYMLHLSSTRADESYAELGFSLFAKVQVADPSNWFLPTGTKFSTPFPNPFRSDGTSSMNFPVTASAQATLSIFTSSMDLVFSKQQVSVPFLNKHVLRWNGRTDDDRIVASGIYFYVIDFGTESIKGKFALIRK